MYKLAEDWFRNEKIRNKLEKEKLKSELSFLRSQINPHFLFNTLNNIYTLTYRKSDKAPDAIGKLSAIMRYMLYESMDAEVLLDKELTYLKHFINLQELRVKGGLKLCMDISGNTDKARIAPLILINFVENTFKHGVLDDADHPVILTVKGCISNFRVTARRNDEAVSTKVILYRRLLRYARNDGDENLKYTPVKADKQQVYFFISNKISDGSKDGQKGIGLTNVQRRLDLLYPQRHRLEISRSEDQYTVELHLTTKYSA